MRSGNLFSKREAAVLDAPKLSRAFARAEASSQANDYRSGLNDGLHHGLHDGLDDGLDDMPGLRNGARRPGLRVSIRGAWLPKTIWGRVALGGGLALVSGIGVAGALAVRSFLLRDEHFTVASSSSIQIAGNSHLTRPQLLSVFGGDVERNIFSIPLAERRAELERLPWVRQATVMRLLPDRIRVAIVERTPVAFVREGNEIGLVDANGVLLDLASPFASQVTSQGDAGGKRDAAYSFPVLTGISASDPLSTRAARMKIYRGFIAELDSTGEKISQRLSEVDLSNPEDVKAILPDGAAGAGPEQKSDILVHFGDERFLERYRQYQQHLKEWLAQYPRLASVDMRYERQVVLEMQPGTAVSGDGNAANLASAGNAANAALAGARRPAPVAGSSVEPAKTKTPVAPAAARRSAGLSAPNAASSNANAGKTPSNVSVGKAPVAGSAVPEAAAGASAAPVQHLTTAFDVRSSAARTAGRPAARSSAAGSSAPGNPTPASPGVPR